ncbi:MAG: GNAT family N-acetyltransferase [Dehalococcoidales bacterium]|nr:GNAT family N-acetyltransferase [Dehalococcoidales bacterium]
MDRNIELTNGIITLRPYRGEDVDALFEAARESIPEMTPWMPWCHPDYSIQESRDWIALRPEHWEKGTSYDFTIRDATTDRYLGGCGLNGIHRGPDIANLGYWVRTSATGKGVATTTTLLLADFGISELNLKRIEIVVDVDNIASQRVAEKSGATREGILRNRLEQHGKPTDAVMFSLIPPLSFPRKRESTGTGNIIPENKGDSSS